MYLFTKAEGHFLTAYSVVVTLCLVQDFVSLKIKHRFLRDSLEAFSVRWGGCFSITSVDSSNCFSACGHSASSPFSRLSCRCLIGRPPGQAACPLPSFASNVCTYSSLACRLGSSGGLTCLSEGLISVLDVGPIPRRTSQGAPHAFCPLP